MRMSVVVRNSSSIIPLLLFISSTALAQKAPQLGYVYPPAIRAGEATEVQLGGFDFTSDMQWFVHDEQVRLHVLGTPGEYHLPPPPYWIGPRASTPALPIPREVPARIDVNGDRPAGLVRWQVANANGSSATAMFYVSHGTEIMESRSRDFPQRLPSLPVAVSGRLSRLTEVDRYELVAEQDGLISVDLMARRLGSGFNGVLQVRDPAGELLADFADTQGLDGGVAFAAKSGATYTISLHDADFRGDRSYVYRLAVSRGPRVVCTLPAYGQRGTSREVEFVGVGVASGKAILETILQTVAFPSDPASITHTHSLKTTFGTVEVTMPLSGVIENTRDANAVESAEATFSIAAPIAVTSVLPPNVDEHRYSWSAEKDESWSIDLQSRGIGGRLDVAITVLDPDGKQAAENDDLPGTPDAAIEFHAAANGTYACVVRSMSSRVGAADEVYRLQIERRSPDFSLTVPQQINLPLGGKTDVTVQAVRSGGFAGEIVLSAEDLPAGVTPQGEWTIPAGKSVLKVAIQAAPDAAVVAGMIQFRGTAQIGEATVTRQATAVAAGNLCPRTAAEQRVPQVLLAMTMTPPFDVLVVDRERQHDVHRGTTFLAELEIVRKDGFTGEIQLEMSAQQARYRCGIRGPIIRVPADATRAFYPCFMPEWLGTELTRRMVVHGVAIVPDPKGNLRQLTKPGDARITMIMEGALLKLSCDAKEPTLRPGESLDVPVVISRSPKLPLATTINLVFPDEIAGLLHAEPLVLPAGTDHGTLRITSMPDARLEGPWSLTLTATALQDGQWPVMSETDLSVVFTNYQNQVPR
jgi:hypothetical protein